MVSIAYEELILRVDEARRMVEMAHKQVTMVDAKGNAADACQIGKAVAFLYIAKQALQDTDSVLGRTTKTLWE